MQFVGELRENDDIQSVYHIKIKSQAKAKTGKDYFNVQLEDKTGIIDGKIWDVTSPGIEEFSANDFCFVEGEVIAYNNQLQVRIKRIRVADADEYNATDYFAASKYSAEELAKDLDSLIGKVKNTNYLRLLKSYFIEDKSFREKFLSHQGAKIVHHSFIRGLAEHTVSTTKLALVMAENYEDINADLVVTASLLHDIGKIDEISSYPQNEYTDEGYLVGHIVMGYEMVKSRIKELGNFTKTEEVELLHVILSHHGSTEFGSPKLPMLMEAYLVSQADNTDAKLEIMREAIKNAKVTNKMDSNGFVENNKFVGTRFRESKL